MYREESFGVIPIRENGGIYQVFLVQLASGKHWGFPKGHRNNDVESPKEVASRELKEETNLEIKRYISDISFQETYCLNRSSKEIEKRVTYFLVEAKDNNIILQSKEILDGGWFNVDNAIEKITYQNSKDICTKLKSILKEVVL